MYSLFIYFIKNVLFQGSLACLCEPPAGRVCVSPSLLFSLNKVNHLQQGTVFLLFFLFLLKVSDKIFSPWFLNWWNTTHDVLPSAVPLMAAGSDRFSTLQLLTGTSLTKYRQRGAWPDHGLIWSFHFSGELGARGQSQAYRFAARLQYLHAINSLAVTVFV